MNATPLVSILIPVFNRENEVRRAIQSALAQTYPHIEIIVVDNHSTDNTFAVIQSYAGQDSRIRCYQNKTNLGPVPNWLKCVEHSQGQYIKILFSDDWLDPEAISQHIEPFLRIDTLAFTFSKALRHSTLPDETETESFLFDLGPGHPMSSLEFVEGFLTQGRKAFGYYPVSPGAAMFHRDDIERSLKSTLGSYPFQVCTQSGIGADMLIFLHACERHKHVYYIEEPINHFLVHESGLSFLNLDNTQRCYLSAYLWFMQTTTLSFTDKFQLYKSAVTSFIRSTLSRRHTTREVNTDRPSKSSRLTLVSWIIVDYLRMIRHLILRPLPPR